MQSVNIFMKERLPIVPNFILAFGLVFSALALANSQMDAGALLFGVFALFTFVSELRFMDELKDVEKDIVANPDRPLPRGAIDRKTVGHIINITGLVLVLFVAAAFSFFSSVSGALLAVSALWLFLMYKEFFIGDWLSSRPILYAISHQIVIFPLCLFALALFAPEAALNPEAFAFGGLVLSAFFSFEIGRKLDPNAHPVLKTYLVVSGARRVALYIVILQALAVFCGWYLGALWWIAAPSILIVLTLPKLFSRPEDFKKLEGLISLNLIYVIWALAIRGWVA
ncbi:MAG: hypothetical protein WD025_04550 [Bacteriovoracaceae bacterium]